MKQKLQNRNVIISFFLLILSSSIAYSDPNFVTHWKFDEGNGSITADFSENGNTGTLTNGPVWTTGKIGNGISVDGVNDYVGGNKLIKAPQVTISAWFKIASVPATNTNIVGFANGADTGVHDKELYLDTSGKLRFYVYDGGSKHTAIPNVTVPLNEWVYAASTADGTNAKVYMNGALIGSVSAGNTYAQYSQPNVFVARSSSSFSYLNGSIDEVRIYNRSLSSSEIQQIYSEGMDSTAPSVPQNVIGSALGQSSTQLSWLASLDAETGVNNYRVYRDNTLIAQPVTTTFNDNNLLPGTNYSYEISAVNGVGMESARSSAIIVATLADLTPPSVINVSANGTTVTVVFSEQISNSTAANILNYAVNNGITILEAILQNPTTVRLTTNQHADYVLSVNNVQDTSGNGVNNSQTNYRPQGCP